MIGWFRAWRAQRKQPSPSRVELQRQVRRAAALRRIVARELARTGDNPLEPIIFPDQRRRT